MCTIIIVNKVHISIGSWVREVKGVNELTGTEKYGGMGAGTMSKKLG